MGNRTYVQKSSTAQRRTARIRMCGRARTFAEVELYSMSTVRWSVVRCHTTDHLTVDIFGRLHPISAQPSRRLTSYVSTNRLRPVQSLHPTVPAVRLRGRSLDL